LKEDGKQGWGGTALEVGGTEQRTRRLREHAGKTAKKNSPWGQVPRKRLRGREWRNTVGGWKQFSSKKSQGYTHDRGIQKSTKKMRGQRLNGQKRQGWERTEGD